MALLVSVSLFFNCPFILWALINFFSLIRMKMCITFKFWFSWMDYMHTGQSWHAKPKCIDWINGCLGCFCSFICDYFFLSFARVKSIRWFFVRSMHFNLLVNGYIRLCAFACICCMRTSECVYARHDESLAMQINK